MYFLKGVTCGVYYGWKLGDVFNIMYSRVQIKKMTKHLWEAIVPVSSLGYLEITYPLVEFLFWISCPFDLVMFFTEPKTLKMILRCSFQIVLKSEE